MGVWLCINAGQVINCMLKNNDEIPDYAIYMDDPYKFWDEPAVTVPMFKKDQKVNLTLEDLEKSISMLDRYLPVKKTIMLDDPWRKPIVNKNYDSFDRYRPLWVL